MPSRRLASVLGPLIALLLIGGVTAAVLGGPDDPGGTDFAAEPTEDPGFSASPSPEPTTDGATPAPTETATAVESESETVSPIASEQGTPAPAAPGPSETGTPPPATPRPAPTSGSDDIGSQPAVDDGALTGGWVGGTPDTGTAISAAGLLLLAIGGGLLWLRRSRA